MPIDTSQVEWDDEATGNPFYDGVRNAISPLGGRITSTNGGRHNVGSAHYSGHAVDVGMGRETPEQQEQIKAKLEAAGYHVRDERTRPAGQAVWGGPHLHVSMMPAVAKAVPTPPRRPVDAAGQALGLLGVGSANAGELPPAAVQWDAPAIDANAVQWDDQSAAPAANEEVGLLEGVLGRASQLLGSGVRGVANVAEPIGDWLESKVPLSGLTPEQIANEKQLQPLYDLSDWFNKTGQEHQYQPGVSFQDVKEDPISLKTPQFIVEQGVTSIPDMAAAVYTLPAYVLGRTEEIAEKRVQNDATPSLSDLITGDQPTVAPGTEPGLGDMAAAAPGALIESLLERFATKRLGIGGEVGGNVATRIGKEVGVQALTEAGEEGAANLGESLGTQRGVKPGELGDAMMAGGLVGGGIGAGVQGVKEVAGAVRGQPEIKAADVQWDDAAPQQENAQPAPDKASSEIPPSDVAPPLPAASPASGEVVAPAAAETAATPVAEALPEPVEVSTPVVAEAPVEVETPRRRVEEVESARILELRQKRREAPLAPEESSELVDLMERDAHAAKVSGRRMQGVQNMAARTELEQAGQLKPTQAFADADDFKSFNDQMGHETGDTVIRALGEEFSAALGDGNVFHRGGDEFVLQADNPEQMAAAMEAVRNRLAQAEFVVTTADGQVITRKGVGFSYGVGSNSQEAENAQFQDKSARKAAGLRTGARDPATADTVGDRAGRGEVDRAEGDESRAPVAEALTDAKSFTARTKGGEFRLTDAPAPAGTDFSEFGDVRQVEAFDGDKRIGKLVYANDGTPPTVEVEPEYRRKGVATAMLKLAKQQGDATGGIRGKGAEYRTADGQAFRSKADESTAELAPLLESTNDGPDISEGLQREARGSESAAPREAAELEERGESAGLENSRRKGAGEEFMRASFTNRRSWQQAAFRDAGLDPDAAELLPADKQFDAIAKATKDKFGITIAKTEKAPSRMAIDSALDLYRNAEMMAHVLGMPVKAIGLNDSLTLLFRGNVPYLGAMYPGGATVEGVKIPAGSIALPRRSNSFAHEWGHALDLFLVSKYGMDPLAGLTTRQIRADGIDAQPDTSKAAFANLMNAMFFDEAALAARVAALQQAATNGTDKQQAAAKEALEKIAKGNSKLKIQGTQYLIDSRVFGAMQGGKSGAQYFGDPAELLARAFEAYVAERVENAGGSTEVLAKGDSAYLSNNDERFALTFPKTADRVRIFAAFDDLFGQLAEEQMVAQGVAAANPGNMDVFDPRIWLGDTGKRPEYRGLKGAWKEQVDQWNAHREQSRREAARPADPMSRKARIQNSLMAWTTPVQGVFRTMERRYPGSKAVRELANKLVTAPGVNRTVGRVYEQAVRITMGRGYNQFGNIVDRYSLNALDEAGRTQLRRLLVSAADPGKAKPELVKAAAELRRFMDSLWYDNQEAGINIGYTPNGYLPRITDLAMIQADQAGFIKAAGEAYEISITNEGKVTDPAEIKQLAEAQARAWLFNLTSAPGMDFGSKTPAENYAKHRSLPAEADVLLEKFYVSDPLEVIHRYIGMSARNIEFGKQFGPKGEQLNDLFSKMATDGVLLEDQKYLQGSVASLLGRQPAGYLEGKPRAQAIMNQVNAYGVMSMLGRVVISSIAEPGMAGIRTGSAAAVYKPYFNLFKQMIGTADMAQWREITRAIGLIGDAQADMVVQARLGGTYESTPKTDARLARYFAITGLHALTNAQRISLMPVTHRYLAQLVDQVRVGSPAEAKEGRALLAELGIDNPAEFRIDTRAPTMTELFDGNGRETEFGGQYMTAMSRINEQIVQAPNRYDRPEMANSQVGRFLYGIMSFNLAFWNNVYKREANVIKRQAKERGALGVASYVGGHLAPPLIAYFFTQMLVTIARESLLNPQRWEEWDRDDKLVENVLLLTLSRSFPMGLFDIPIQAYQGLKYQRDLTGVAVGAVPSYFLGAAQKIVNVFREENSEKTNNAEFSGMQGAYQAIANPLIAHLLTALPGGRILDPIYGVALAVGTSAAARDEVAEAVVGERDSLVAKRERDEKRAQQGVESSGGRGSGRGSVRNSDQRGSTR